jgi:hypothetical protein
MGPKDGTIAHEYESSEAHVRSCVRPDALVSVEPVTPPQKLQNAVYNGYQGALLSPFQESCNDIRLHYG